MAAVDPRRQRSARRQAWLGLWLAVMGSAAAPAAPPALVPVSAEQRANLGIEVAAPQPVDEVLGNRHPAEVAVPNASLHVVGTPQSGVVESLRVAVGEHVEADQPLAYVRSPALLSLQQAFIKARIDEQLARRTLARTRQAVEEGLTATSALHRAESAWQETSAYLEQHRRLLRLAGMSAADVEGLVDGSRLSSRMVIRSPLSGVVLDQLVSTGERVDAAAPLYRVADLGTLWLEIHVPPADADRTRVGDAVVVPGLDVRGRVVTVGRQIHAVDQGVLVRAEVGEGSERLRPGQFVEVQLECDCPAGVHYRLPRAAVVHHAGRAWIFVQAAGGFRARAVEVFSDQAEHVVVRGELEQGARVAVSGTATLKAAWLGVGGG